MKAEQLNHFVKDIAIDAYLANKKYLIHLYYRPELCLFQYRKDPGLGNIVFDKPSHVGLKKYVYLGCFYNADFEHILETCQHAVDTL